MSPTQPPFYPPRARWYGGIFYLWHALARGLRLEETRSALGCSWPHLLAVLVLPGYGFFAGARPATGRRVIAAYGLAAAVGVVWPGYAVANLAFASVISLHAVGAIFCLGRLWRLEFRRRVDLTIAVLLVVAGGLYLPLRHWVTTRWALPLRIHGQVVLVDPRADAAAVKRGDWVAYRMEKHYLDDHRYIAGGYGLGQVQGVAGDRLRFTADGFWVNDQRFAALARMPRAGEWGVPEKQWFVWSEWVIRDRGVSSATIAAALNQVAFVDEAQFAGMPYDRWFWRRQILPTFP